MPNTIKRCPKCGGVRFSATAHVAQDWTLDMYGTFMGSKNDCLETTHYPDDEDIWDCDKCGYSDAGAKFNVTAKELWEEFDNVPINAETECIESPWFVFSAGTSYQKIWTWFEKAFGVSVHDLMLEDEEPKPHTSILYHDNTVNPQYGSDGKLLNNWDADAEYGPNELVGVYFRINCPTYDSWSGFKNEDDRKAFHEEASSILSRWSIDEDSGYNPKRREYLYVHPQTISGVLLKNNIKKLAEAFAQCKTFALSWVDLYEDYYELTDDEYRNHLLAKAEEIKKDILENCKTKRRDLYVVCDYMDSALCQRLMSKYHLQRPCRNGNNKAMDGIFTKVFFDLLQELEDAGLIVSRDTKRGKGYRTQKPK